MYRLSRLAVVACALASSQVSALELTNIRPAYGPLGATRTDTKCVPGDILFITYDIEGLKIDAKTLKASYKTTLELIDNTGTVTFSKPNNNDVSPQLGGTRMPGDLFIQVPLNQKPGKYKVRLTVSDNQDKVTKSFDYAFDVTEPQFAFAKVAAKAVGFPGESYFASFAIVNMALNDKKQPNVDIAMRVFDETGKKLVTSQLLSNLPRDIPDEIDLKKENAVPMQFPIYLNRTGTFILEVVAADKLAKKTIQLRFPLKVIDLSGIGPAK